MKKAWFLPAAMVLLSVTLVTSAFSFSLFSRGEEVLSPSQGKVQIPIADISDGKAHHFTVKAGDGTNVVFFVLKSRDGVIRAAIDTCDVCYRSGKGYYQEGDFMVCENCGQRFASDKINVIKGGCNPAPLERQIVGKNLEIAMADINKNTWYMAYRR